MRWTALAALLLALPAAASPPDGSGPPVAIEATPAANATLYFHVARGADFPITPQAPDPAFRLDEGVGLATHSLSCVPSNTPVDGLTQHEYTTYYGYAAAGTVRYGEAQPSPSLQPGLGAPLDLDLAAPLTLRWFMSTATGAPASGSDAVPVPGVVVRATVRLGERVSPDNVAYNQGAIVAQGQTPPTTLAGAATAPTPGADASGATPGAEAAYAGTVGGVPVYGFTIPMPAQLAGIPREEGFNVRVDVFERLPACPSQGYVMANLVRLHTSAALRPRLELRELAPLRLEAELEQFLEAQVLHVRAASPWGSDDVDGANATLEAAGAHFVRTGAGPSLFDESRGRQPLDQVWVWNATLRPGSYTATYTVANRAHTATARATVTFQVGARAAPGPGASTGLLLLAAAAALRRR